MLIALIAPLLLAASDVPDEIEERERARALFEAGRADIKDLVRRRRQAADEVFKDLFGARWAAAPITVAMMLDTHLRKTKAALPPRKNDWPEHVLLAEWEIRWAAYWAEKALFEAGRTYRGTYFEAVGSLLEAEIQMAVRREKPPKK